MVKFRLLTLLHLLTIILYGSDNQALSQHRYIVKYRQEAGVQRFGPSLGNLGGRKIADLPLIHGEVFSLARPLSEQEIQAFQTAESQRIEYLEPDFQIQAFDQIPNDPFFTSQWGGHNTGAEGGVADVDVDLPAAWELSQGSSEIVIVVLDTGVDYTHPDLRNNLWRNAYEIPNNNIDDDRNGFVDDIHGANLIDNSGDPFDDQGHGTQVSGIIGAEGNNGVGISGVNWNVRLLNVKVLDANGSGRTADIVRGVHYAIEAKLFKGANVVAINASLGGPAYSRAMYDAIERARSAGISFVAAAGNSGEDIDVKPTYPAAYDLDNIISVASINRFGNLSNFSNFGYITTDIAAPGERILTTYPAHLTPAGYLPYIYSDGTSFSAPYVAGVLGLMHSQERSLSYRAAQVAIYRTLKTARDVPALRNLRGRVGLGGSINAAKALQYVSTNELDSDGDGVNDELEGRDQTDPHDRGNFNLHLTSPAYTKYNTFLNQQNYVELIAVGVRPVRAELTFFGIDGSVIGAYTVFLDRGEQFHVDVNAIVQKPDTYGLIRIDFNEGQGAQLLGRTTSYRTSTRGDGFAFAFTREFRNPTRGQTHVTSNSYDPQGNSRTVFNWIELINLDEFPLLFTHNIYSQAGHLLSSRLLEVPAQGELDVQGGHEFGQGVFLNEFLPHNPRAPYFASLTRYRLNEEGSDYTYAFSLDAIAATQAEKYIPTFNRTGQCWSQSNWIEVVNTTSEPAPVTLTFRNSDSSLAAQQGVTIPPKAQMHFYASAFLPKGSTGWVGVTPWIPESIISQGLVYYHHCQANRLQTAFGIPASEPHRNLLQGTFNQYLGVQNVLSLINPNTASISDGAVALYYPQTRYDYSFGLRGLSSRLGFINVQEPWAVDNYGTLEVLGSLFPPNNRLVVHNFLERPDGRGGIDYVIPTSVK